MRRPGFTILELVIALGLVVLLGALAAPALFERLGDSRLDAAGRALAAVAATVRADALREGRPLELRAERDGATMRLVSAPLEAAGNAEPGAEPPVVTLRAELPAGVDASETPPSAGGVVAAPAAVAVQAPPPGVVLGVLLPDGSAWSSKVTYLALANAPTRALEVKLNSWTGVATVTEVPLAAPLEPNEEPAP